MMWNFLVSGLAAGCTLVLYDGSPLRDPAYLWRLVDDLGITLFGTSAKYIDQLSVRLSLYLALFLVFNAIICSVAVWNFTIAQALLLTGMSTISSSPQVPLLLNFL